MRDKYGVRFDTPDGRVLRVRRIGLNFYAGTLPGNFRIMYGPYATAGQAEKRAEAIAAGATPRNSETLL